MTTIKKLALLGIRSYGTEKETTITFDTPLTIILGRNGSGKSTIIEAVKMATTGELPPMVDRGAAFIHDPRIHNELETKAKIRLLFINAGGQSYVVSRHFQLALKKGPRGVGYKTEFKTLDQTVMRSDPSGDKATSSYRCTNLNALLPEIMRVTKPVLNNVIFVHQEESLWPLADPKKLKEKFDEIFAATRYTKALDTIRKYRKDQQAELRTVNVELLRYEDKVKDLEKKRAEVDEIRVRHDQLRQGIDALDTEIMDLTEKKNAAQQICNQYQRRRSELADLQVRREVLEQDKASKYSQMEQHLPDMDDAALRTEISALKESLDKADSERSKRARLIQDLQSDIDMKREEFHKRQSRKGMLQQQSKMQADRLSRLDGMKVEFEGNEFFSQGHMGSGAEPSLPHRSDDVASWTQALERLCKDARDNVKAVTQKGNESLDVATKSLNDLKLRLQEAQSESKRNTKDIAEKKTRISTIRNELRSLDDTEASITEAENRLTTVQRRFQEKTASNQVSILEAEKTELKKRMAAQMEDLTVLRRSREDLVQNQSEQARYELLRESAVKKRKRTERLAEDFTDILLSAIPEVDSEGESEFSRLQDKLKSADELTEENAEERRRELVDISAKVLAKRDTLLQQAERRKNEADAILKSAELRNAEAQSQMDQALVEMAGVHRKVKEINRSIQSLPNTAVKIDEVTKLFGNLALSRSNEHVKIQDEELDFVEKSMEAVNDAVLKKGQEISQLESGKLLAQSDLESFEKDSKHRCPACGLSSAKKVESMRAKLTERVNYFQDPQSLRKAQEELSSLEQMSCTLRHAQTVGSNAASSHRNFASILEKASDAKRAVVEQEKALREAESCAEGLEERIGGSSGLEQIVEKRSELNQAFSEWERNRDDVRKTQESLSATSSVVQSLSEVEEQIRDIEEEQQKLQESIEKTSRAIEREKDDLRREENRLHQARQRCLELQTQAEKHKRLKLEKEDFTRSVRELESKTEQLRGDVKNLETELEYAQAEYATVRAENEAALRDANYVLSKREIAIHSWNECLRGVEAYERSGKEKDLESLTKSLESMKSDIETLTTDLRAHEKDQQAASDSQKDTTSRIRNLEDNQEYRTKERELQINGRDARRLEDEIAALVQRSGGRPPDKVGEVVDEINRKNAERSATLGQRQVYTERYKRSKKELDEAEKLGSRRKFDECRIKKQTMQLALSDLEKYHRALDQALMAFHTLKMNSINRTIKELWQQTYRGTDIDEIEIISDHGDPRAPASGALKRAFNYKVQMRRGQATLDMRGRCSAGQKVLACLVIRLALAESFCTDCGILALDEPTTNLDRENIESLGAALKTIIESRRKQRNFQLVLITHDQEFIDMIGARDFCKDYFLVRKDMQGISHAEKHHLQEI